MPSSASFNMRAIAFLCLLGLTAGQGFNFGGSSNSDESSAIPICEMNDAACGCCQMQKQMHKMEEFFSMSLDKLQADMQKTKDSLNRVQESRSAFSVALTNERSCRGPFLTDTTLVYEHVFINIGDNYNQGTGKYTVPSTGVYSLSLTVYSDAGAPGNILRAHAKLMINHLVVAEVNETSREDSEDSISIVLAMLLNEGDMVYVIQPIGSILCDSNSHYNTFTVFLLYHTD